jgi:hypothetical protein
MIDGGGSFHGTSVVPPDVFYKLNPDFFIGGSDNNTKYMCANYAETAHLESLGIQAGGACCDWYEIKLDTSNIKPDDAIDFFSQEKIEERQKWARHPARRLSR